MRYVFTPRNVCCSQISFDLSDGIVSQVQFLGGCNGNQQGVARLVEGMSAADAAKRLRGIHCGNKSTSCPDQFSQALELAIEEERKNRTL